MAGKLLIRK